MKRRAFLAGLVSGLTLAGPALAGDVIDSIVRQLKKQGFRSVVQERTLLGRVRIVAKRKDGTREIIVNPRTGEILRDLWTPLNGVPATGRSSTIRMDAAGPEVAVTTTMTMMTMTMTTMMMMMMMTMTAEATLAAAVAAAGVAAAGVAVTTTMTTTTEV